LTFHSLKIKGDAIELCKTGTPFDPVGPTRECSLVCASARVGGAHQRNEKTTLDASVWATYAAKNCDNRFDIDAECGTAQREFGVQRSPKPITPTIFHQQRLIALTSGVLCCWDSTCGDLAGIQLGSIETTDFTGFARTRYSL